MNELLYQIPEPKFVNSLIYIINNNGPKIEPCGTPKSKDLLVLQILFMTTAEVRLLRYEVSHFKTLPLIPK